MPGFIAVSWRHKASSRGCNEKNSKFNHQRSYEYRGDRDRLRTARFGEDLPSPDASPCLVNKSGPESPARIFNLSMEAMNDLIVFAIVGWTN